MILAVRAAIEERIACIATRAAMSLVILALAAWVLAGCTDGPGGEGTGGGTGAATGGGIGGGFGGGAGGNPVQDAGGQDTPQPQGDQGGSDGPESDVVSCTPFETTCAGPLTQQQCNPAGDGWIEAPCPADKGCVDGECVDQVCSPGASTGECIDPVSFERCNDSGTAWETVVCSGGTKCFKGICIESLCTPGNTICKSPTQPQECDVSGDFWVDLPPCPSGGLCNEGQCLSPCQVNIKAGSYLGCDYWAMDLDNIEDAQYATVGVVVSVPAEKAGTTVTITNNATGLTLTPAELGVADNYVDSGQVEIFALPSGFDIDGTVKTNKTFRIETTSPVAVHQFNPLNGVGVFTNDASLLLPSNVTGRDYVVMSWPHRSDGFITLRGFATIIATQEGLTQVKIVPSAPVVAGPGVSALNPDTPYLFVLNQGEALNLMTDGAEGEDLTGTTVESDQKISVIAGHECGNVPLGITACDHMESQLFPVETWSTQYVADIFSKRSPSQVDIFRIIAGDNDVTVTTSPPVPGYETFKLQRGGWIEFSSADPFMVEADGPILVGHYLTGANYPGSVDFPECELQVGKPEPIGDPAFTLAAPVKRFLSEYAVLTPQGYMQDFLNIIAQPGTTITIDGQPVTAPFVAIPGTGYSLATQAVSPGIHTVEGDAPFGLTAYGYDCDVSYAYPGGLKLQGLD